MNNIFPIGKSSSSEHLTHEGIKSDEAPRLSREGYAVSNVIKLFETTFPDILEDLENEGFSELVDTEVAI